MLDNQQYRDLLLLVNDKGVMELLEIYARARIELRRDQLEQTQQPDRFEFTQGILAELRRPLNLRDEIIGGAK